MQNLNGAFLYITLLGWCLIECVYRATQGHAFALLLFVLAFLVVFSVLGCLNLSDQATNLVGGVSTGLLALGLVLFTVAGAVHGASLVTNLVKGFGAVLAVVFAVSSILPLVRESKKASAHGH